MKKVDLCGAWTLWDDTGKQYSASVPGCVHTDVAGIENLYWRDNYEKYLWIEEKDWIYKREFNLDSVKNNAFLVFECLDVYCDIYLNGVHVKYCDNMFIPHRINVDGILKTGKNELEVRFYSPTEKVKDCEKREAAFTAERLNTRRVQCTYGWDWVARFLTCGISRPVYLEFDDEFRIDNVYVYTDTVDEYGAVVRVSGQAANYDPGSMVNIAITAPDGSEIYKKKEYITTRDFDETICIENPELWYPAGYGAQPLYNLKISYAEGSFNQKFGIRTVRILENPDMPGSEYYNKCLELKKTPSAEEYDQNEEFTGFILIVNGVKIMCKGSNWVPIEPLVSEEKTDKITTVLELAKECGTNMLRVWGGGKFEQPHFYDECDRLGIMIIHDFLMACGEYPDGEQWFIDELLKETEYAAKLLRNHPCLMWWHGDNENAINGSFEDKIYKGKRAAYKGILPVLKKYDYTRRFLPSSPYGGKKFASKTAGTTHNTQYLSYIFDYIDDESMQDYKEYFNTYCARFVSEEPTMGAVCEESLLKMMTQEDIHHKDMKMWYTHTQSNPALKHELMDYMVTFAEKVLGEFSDTYDRYFKFKYVQYEWIRITFENIRRNKWFSSGIIYWMLNDCWPAAAGWSLIDYYCMPKASFYSFKRCSKDIIASIEKKTDSFEITLCNDSINDVNLVMDCYVLNYKTNAKQDVYKENILSIKNECMKFDILMDLPQDSIAVCDLYRDGCLYDRSFYKNGNLNISPCDNVRIIRKTESEITLAADSYTHAVELKGNYIFDDNYFTMLKGEERTVRYRKADLKAEADRVDICTYSI